MEKQFKYKLRVIFTFTMVIGIVAFCQNYGISFKNNIPWRISEDLKFFRKMTKDSIVVMGRKTFESIGHPLTDRLNIVHR